MAKATDAVIAETRTALAAVYAVPAGKRTFANTALALNIAAYKDYLLVRGADMAGPGFLDARSLRREEPVKQKPTGTGQQR